MPADDTAPVAPEEAPLLQIRGERVGLGPLRRDLLPLYWRWANDFAYSRTTGSPGLTLSVEQLTRMYDAVVVDEHTVSFVIYDQATGQAIGTTALEQINQRNRTAEFSIGIGEAVYRGKGYGTEATRLVLDYAFTVLGLHNVMLVVYEFNYAGQRAYEKAGFRVYGRRRESHWMGGRLWDTIYMECLASEFTSPVLRHILRVDEPSPSAHTMQPGGRA